MAHTISDRPSSEPDDFPADLREQLDTLTQRETNLETKITRRDNATVLVYVASVVALIVAIVGVGFGARALDESKSSTGEGRGGAAATNAPATAEVHLSEFKVDVSSATVAEGAVLEVMNMGTMQHDLAVKGTDLKTAMLGAGESAKLDLKGLAPGDYTIICTVPGHEAAGMSATLKVGGGSGTAAAASTSGSTAAAASASAKIDANATPAPEWKPFDPTLQPAAGATVHDVEFTATEKVIEVAPGVTQEMWTFNDQVPGPVLRGHVGDVFNVKLTNGGKIAHSIDFHASKVAPNVEMRTLQPGESLTYQFKAEFSGIWMYHCGTAPALHHIGNGMYGTVIIDPPNLPAVAHEYVMVQSELYLGPNGQPGDLAKMVDEKQDAVVFNNYFNQYKFAPIKVGVGERVRVWVLDAGPSENSSFHVVGTIWDTVFKEGAYLLRPGNATQGGSQTLDLQPAQGGFVEFTLDHPGLYPMVTHKFANVGKGALGIFQAGDVAGTMNH